MKCAYLSRSLLALFAILSSGCATVLTGTDHQLSVNTNVDGAKCKLTNSKGVNWYIKETPGSALVKKGDSPITVTCEKAGYAEARKEVKCHINGVSILNILVGGVIGFGYDIVTGAITSYPDDVDVNLDPTPETQNL